MIDETQAEKVHHASEDSPQKQVLKNSREQMKKVFNVGEGYIIVFHLYLTPRSVTDSWGQSGSSARQPGRISERRSSRSFVALAEDHGSSANKI